LVNGTQVAAGTNYFSYVPSGSAKVEVRVKDMTQLVHSAMVGDALISSRVWNVVAETVSTPTITGPTAGSINKNCTFSASGAIDSISYPVQYFFDWGDGTNSGWLSAGTASVSKSWTLAGVYPVKVQARSATNQNVVSVWSVPLLVVIAGLPKIVLAVSVTAMVVDVPQNLIVVATDENGKALAGFSVTINGAGTNLVGTAGRTGKLTFRRVSVNQNWQIVVCAVRDGYQDSSVIIPVAAAEFLVSIQSITRNMMVVVRNAASAKPVVGAAVSIAGQTFLTSFIGRVSVPLGLAQGIQQADQIPIRITKSGYIDWNASFDVVSKTLK